VGRSNIKKTFPAFSPVTTILAALFALGVTAIHAQTYSFVSFPNNSTHSNASVMAAITNVPMSVGVVYDANGQTNDIQIWNYGTGVYTGAVDISSTLQRIRNGQSVANTESDDGGFFNFYPYEFPNIPRKGNNYYMEFVVWPFLNLTNGTYYTGTNAYNVMSYPGAMRILVGLGGEVYFTGDHYGEDGPQQNAYYLVPSPSQAVGNSWTNATGGKWEIAQNWLFAPSAPPAAPSVDDPAELITNAGNKTVTLDGVTAGYVTNLSVLSINNLVLSAPAGSTNILLLTSGFTNTLQITTSFSILSGGLFSMNGGSLTVGNNAFIIDGGAVLTGGTINVYSNLVVGDCGASVTGTVAMSGGTLYVTNAAHNAVLEVRSGSFIMSGGKVVADNLVMTNACGLFQRNGGITVISSMNLAPNLSASGDGIPNGWALQYGLDPLNPAEANEDPDGDGFTNLQEYLAGTNPNDPNSSPFRITAIARQGSDVLITWTTVGGKTNVVQVSTGTANGSYTNNYANLSSPIAIPGTSVVSTNYLDAGGATNQPSRFYRVKMMTSQGGG